MRSPQSVASITLGAGRARISALALCAGRSRRTLRTTIPSFALLAGVPVPLALGESYGSHCQPTAATRGEPMGSTDASGGAQETLTHTRLVRGQAGCTSGLQAVSRLGSCKTTAIAFNACICCHNASMVCPLYVTLHRLPHLSRHPGGGHSCPFLPATPPPPHSMWVHRETRLKRCAASVAPITRFAQRHSQHQS